MKINHVVELEDGTAKFEGTLEGAELDFVVEMGLNILLAHGAIKADRVATAPSTDTLQ